MVYPGLMLRSSESRLPILTGRPKEITIFFIGFSGLWVYVLGLGV